MPAGLSGFRNPGAAFGGAGEGVEPADAVTDGAEDLGSVRWQPRKPETIRQEIPIQLLASLVIYPTLRDAAGNLLRRFSAGWQWLTGVSLAA